MKPSEILELSLKNRFDFLEEKKQDFIECKSERKQKDIIVELIQLEPSHLAEKWILDQVIKRLKDRGKNIEFLQSAFIAKGQRDEPTERQIEVLRQSAFLWYEIKKHAEKYGSQAAAIREKIIESDDDSLPDDPELAIKQQLKRFRQAYDNRTLPFPYYGKDIVEFDRGNENHRIEIYLKNKINEIKGLPVFGDLAYTIPLKINE